VPFVDVMNDMLDASLPLTTSEYLEWGNPNKKSEFDYMLRYSPYDNIKRQSYPALLVKTSLSDSQVMYWEGAKYTAKLRVFKTDDSPLLLKVNFGAGHGGASGRYDALREMAIDWTFALWQTKAPVTTRNALSRQDDSPKVNTIDPPGYTSTIGDAA
jgi:oligopeptidase B